MDDVSAGTVSASTSPVPQPRVVGLYSSINAFNGLVLNFTYVRENFDTMFCLHAIFSISMDVRLSHLIKVYVMLCYSSFKTSLHETFKG